VRIVVGVSPDESGDDGLSLGALLARLLGARITLAYVHPPTIDYPSMGHVDAEWAAFLRERSEATLSRATDILRREWSVDDVDTLVVPRSSVGHGLREAADDIGAVMIVIGPGSEGVDGHLALGSVAHSLLHGGAAAVALAPEGYREVAPDAIGRLVVGFQDTPESEYAVGIAESVARPTGLPVHLLTVVLRMTRILGARIGRDPERAVMQALREHEESAQRRFIERSGLPIAGSVVEGDTAGRAMSRFDWQDSDVFVAASSSLGVLSRVFLGDLTHKLLRACTVPAVVLPRGFDPEGLIDA
jgi:nucleotide-binding universal stress UspA family protein